MEKTKETKKEKQSKEKPTWGDIIFRCLVIVCIFLISVLFYAYYIGR